MRTLTEIKLNKNQLDGLGTILGIIAGIATILATQGYMDQKLGGTISGIATLLLGYVVQKPASAPPTTEDVEEKEVKS